MQWIAPQRSSRQPLSLQRVYEAAEGRALGDSVAAGLPVRAGGKLAGERPPASRRQLQILRARINRPKLVGDLLASSRSGDEFAEGLKSLLAQTSEQDEFRLLWAVFKRVMDDGDRLPLAADFQIAVLERLAQWDPEHSVAKWASMRLESVQRGIEWNRLRSALGGLGPTRLATHREPSTPTPVSPFQVESTAIQPASLTPAIVVPKAETVDLATGRERGTSVDLLWEFHPIVLVNREAARHRGDEIGLQTSREQSGNLNRLIMAPGAQAWGQLLRSEGPVIQARRATKPPKLDGKLIDPCWAFALPRAGESISTRVAYDDDYLYFAVRARADMLRSDSQGDGQTGERDARLDDVDRIRLCVDVDLDLLSSLQFEFSDAGRTRDSIDGHVAWQPTWYIATHRGGRFVDFEIAVLRHDVSDLPLHAGQRFFLSTEVRKAGEGYGWVPIPRPSDWVQIAFR